MFGRFLVGCLCLISLLGSTPYLADIAHLNVHEKGIPHSHHEEGSQSDPQAAHAGHHHCFEASIPGTLASASLSRLFVKSVPFITRQSPRSQTLSPLLLLRLRHEPPSPTTTLIVRLTYPKTAPPLV